MKKLLPIILLLIGTGAGVGAGVFLRPPPEPVEVAQVDDTEDAEPEFESARTNAPDDEEPAEVDYAKLNNQFVIPLVQDGTVAALVVMSLSVEVDFGHTEEVFRKEPKLRDSFLQVMFDHANIGGFRGDFTQHENLAVLRSALREVAMRDVGEHVRDVLILEIARQDY